MRSIVHRWRARRVAALRARRRVAGGKSPAAAGARRRRLERRIRGHLDALERR